MYSPYLTLPSTQELYLDSYMWHFQNMAEEIIVAWKVGSDDSEVKIENAEESENKNGMLEEPDCLTVPNLGLEMKEPQEEADNGLEIPEKESVSRVNSAASYGSVSSFGSLGGDDQRDEKGAWLMRRRSKKASVCSNLSTFSNSSEQPYISMMSNVSRDRKLSSMSSDSFSSTRHSSGGSVKTRKISEGIPPFISMMSQNDPTPVDYCLNENIQEQSWTTQNHLYGHGKKIYLKNFHGRGKMRRRGEIFPGYEKTIQERANNPEEKYEDTNSRDLLTDAEDQESCKKLDAHRRGSLVEKQVKNYQDEEGSGSAPDLESQFTRQGLRATVCSGQIKPRSKNTTVERSQSMKKPFQKFGDGFLKTFRQLKKK